jgi:hypothetical protein
MAERRPTNSELRLRRLENEEPQPDEDRGILELWDDQAPEGREPDEDAPLMRDAERE